MIAEAAGLFAWLLLCFAVAGLGGWWTASSLRSWYPTLIKPSWNPPNWVFGPVWTILYAMMGVSAWLLWRRRDRPGAKRALGLFLGQLTLNLAWSGIFFGLRSPGGAAAEVVVLWLAIAATILAAWPVDRRSAALLVPYLGWVTFASALTLAIWRLNPA